MPFVSKKQQRWMFANHPEMAKEWAKETNFEDLPEEAPSRDGEGGQKDKNQKKKNKGRVQKSASAAVRLWKIWSWANRM